MKKLIFFVLLSVISVLNSFSQTISQQWATTHAGTGDFSDKIATITMDHSGNYVMGGYTLKPAASKDVLVVKVNAQGDTLWARTYNGNGNGSDAITCIGVDAADNVYAGGYGKSISGGKDFLIIKYNSAGDTLWTRYYNGVGLADDIGVAMSVNAAGTVWMTGTSDGNPGAVINNNYQTVCYNTNGVLQFASTYDNQSLSDVPSGIAIDINNYCYVTGKSDNGFDDDYATVSYNASGVQNWVKRFDGGQGNDRATAITTDVNGSIFVTGRGFNGTDDDFLTIKYSPSGIQQFMKTYDGGFGNDRATGIGVDAAGDLFVSGRSRGSLADDVQLIQYSSTNGGLIGQANYSTPAALNDRPYGMLVTSGGTSYVYGITDAGTGGAGTNYEMMVCRFDHSTFQFAKFYSGTANNDDECFGVAADANGNFIIAGYSNELVTGKDGTWVLYNNSGNQQAVKHYNGIGDLTDKGSVIAVDASGNSYSAGYSFMSGNDHDFLTTKFDANGNIMWSKTFDGQGNNTDEINDMAVDASGNVYVCGISKNKTGNYDYLTIKYNSLGDTLWTSAYNNANANSDDQAASLALDNAGNLIVTGYSTSTTLNDFFTIKYSPAGAIVWTKRWNNTANGNDQAIKVKIDALNNVYVAGFSYNGANNDFKVLQYSSAGVLNWTATYDGGIGNDVPSDLALDADNNVYVTGSSTGDTLSGFTNTDFATVKYDNTGTQIWASRFNGAGNDDDSPFAMAVDLQGNVIVTGQSDSDPASLIKNYDFLTVKYNASGTEMWHNAINGLANGDDAGNDVAVDMNGNIFVTGQQDDGTTLTKNNNCITVLYSPSGVGIWGLAYDGSQHLNDASNAMITDGASQLWITGYSTTSFQKDQLMVKYNYSTGIYDPVTDAAFNVFPNPFSQYFNIEINGNNSPSLSHVEVYNALGQLLMSSNFSDNTFHMPASSLSTGTYLVKIYNGNKTAGTITITKSN